MKDLQKIFICELSDILDAENQLIKALPDLAEAAHSEELRDAFREHLEQTRIHAKRAEQVFERIGEEVATRSCQAMEGLIDEGQLIAKEFEGNAGLDAALISAAQKVEHYEISSYGSLCSWAELLGFADALVLLQATLKEEKETDKLLNGLAIQFNSNALVTDTEKHGELASSFRKVVSSGT